MTTTNRVSHSQPGFVRRIQMSRYRLWIMVEGLLDRAFYGRICGANKSIRECSCNICLPRELPGFEADGKKTLLLIYEYLNKHKLLTSKFGGEKSTVLFFLDKDIDELTHHIIKSKYITYTEYYSADNYAFRFGDLCAALSTWSLLDIQSIRRQIGDDSIRWTRVVADNWRSWVEHCVLVASLGITKGIPTFAAYSLIHDGPYGNIDEVKQSDWANRVMQKSHLPSEQFRVAQNKTAAYVDRIYQKGEHDKIFNGKWYRKFLAEDARCAAGGRKHCTWTREKLFAQCLLITLDYASEWAGRFHRAIDKAVLRLQ